MALTRVRTLNRNVFVDLTNIRRIYVNPTNNKLTNLELADTSKTYILNQASAFALERKLVDKGLSHVVIKS